LGDGDGIEVIERHPRAGEGLLHHGSNRFRVGAARQLRHHPPIEGVDLVLTRHHVGEHATTVFEHRRRRLVARTLNP
jgi:hypothetical protein